MYFPLYSWWPSCHCRQEMERREEMEIQYPVSSSQKPAPVKFPIFGVLALIWLFFYSCSFQAKLFVAASLVGPETMLDRYKHLISWSTPLTPSILTQLIGLLTLWQSPSLSPWKSNHTFNWASYSETKKKLEELRALLASSFFGNIFHSQKSWIQDFIVQFHGC